MFDARIIGRIYECSSYVNNSACRSEGSCFVHKVIRENVKKPSAMFAGSDEVANYNWYVSNLATNSNVTHKIASRPEEMFIYTWRGNNV